MRKETEMKERESLLAGSIRAPKCPDCDTAAMWCPEHQQWECSDGNCDHVGPIPESE